MIRLPPTAPEGVHRLQQMPSAAPPRAAGAVPLVLSSKWSRASVAEGEALLAGKG